MKGEDKVPLGDDMAHFLQKKRRLAKARTVQRKSKSPRWATRC